MVAFHFKDRGTKEGLTARRTSELTPGDEGQSMVLWESAWEAEGRLHAKARAAHLLGQQSHHEEAGVAAAVWEAGRKRTRVRLVTASY